MDLDFQFKIFNKELLDDLVFLFKEDGSYFTREYLTKKYTYSSSDSNLNFVGYICYDNDMLPTAFIGGFPCKIKNSTGELFTALQIGDVITHPKHRRKGLFVQIASIFFEHLRIQKKIDLVFGFPNDSLANTYYNKLGWHKNFPLQGYVFRTNVMNFYGLFHKTKILLFLYRLYLNITLKYFSISKVVSLILNVSEDFKVIKDQDFLRYQLNYSSSTLIKFYNNYYFLKFIDGIQIDFLQINDFDKIEKDLIFFSKLFGVNKFTTICTENSLYLSSLLNVGFKKNSYLTNSGYLFLNDKNKRSNFEFTLLDTDDF